MSELDDPNTVTVTMEEDGYLSMSMKRSSDDGEEEGIEEPDGKRLRLEIAEGEDGQQIIQQVEEIQEHPDLQVEEGNIIQDPTDIGISDGVVIQEEVIQQSQQPAPQYQNLIIQHMDIAEPLSTLKQLLELRLQCSLVEHQFFLQDSIPLDTEKSLVDQCVHGEGMVQINLEVKSQPGLKPKINILDILKPAEEVEESSGLSQSDFQATPSQPASAAPTKVVVPLSDETENITRWIVDQNFRRDQERLKIPFDPIQWTEVHVRHWIQWAVKEFGLENVDVTKFCMNGQQLCELSHPQFVNYIPNDKGDIFWTHLELLRKCKFVAVMQQPMPQAITTIRVASTGGKKWKQNKNRSPRITGDHGFSPGNRTGNNGQIQLWQFLLELLTDKDCREVIQWIGEEGEFKLNNPEMVAQMWGQRKNKPTMNYEKLSRALRYYYDGDMIAKVHGKRFVYKFVCDLKMLLGYSAAELNRQVTMCAEQKLQRVRETLRPTSKPLRTIDISKIATHTVQASLE